MPRAWLPDGQDDLGVGDDAYDMPSASEYAAERRRDATTHADHRQD